MPRVFQNVVYLQIRRRWVGIRFIGWSGRFGEWEGTPEAVIAQHKNGQLYALSTEDPRVISAFNPRLFTAFDHPRVLINGFDLTHLTLQMLLRRAVKRRGFLRSTFVVHIRDEWLGGLSDIEQRATVELAKSLGASGVFIIEAPRELSAPEILSLARAPRPAVEGGNVLVAPR